MRTFKEWSLTALDKTFNLKQVRTSSALEDWQTGRADISDLEQQILLRLREKLIISVHDWNEVELGYNFIGPVMALVDFTTEQFNFFAERSFEGTVDGITIKGKPDGMIASGFREPEKPYFCFQEYKRHKDPDGDPAAQTLAAMLIAQAINEHKHPIYGAHIIGRDWYFMTLENKQYCISEPYVATRDDIFDIFRILLVLKQIVSKLVNIP